MRRLLVLLATGALALVVSGAANAGLLYYSGTLYIQVAEIPNMKAVETGVATVNNTGGLGHLSTLALNTNFLTSVGALISDPNVPTLATVIHQTVALRKAKLKPFSTTGPLTQNTVPVQGNTKICLLLIGCSAWVDVPHLTPNPTTPTGGVGIGGTVTVNGFGSGFRLSLYGVPWTVHTAGKLTNVYTTNAMIPPASRGLETRSWPAFRHGPASNTSSTATTGGRLQAVSASIIATTLMPPSNVLTLENTLTLHFTPEPGLMLLLGSGVAGLALLGRHRIRR
jgi:hypothetical protein